MFISGCERKLEKSLIRKYFKFEVTEIAPPKHYRVRGKPILDSFNLSTIRILNVSKYASLSSINNNKQAAFFINYIKAFNSSTLRLRLSTIFSKLCPPSLTVQVFKYILLNCTPKKLLDIIYEKGSLFVLM